MASRHTFGESVKVNLKDGGIIYNGKIVNIKFTESKVFYDLDVLVWSAETSDKDLHTRIYNIDSAFVESTEGYETGEYITHALNKPGGNVEFTDNNNQSNSSVIAGPTLCEVCGKSKYGNPTTFSSVCECPAQA